MLRGSLLALTACALGGASTSPAPEAAGACLTVQSKVTFPVVLGRSCLQNQTLDGGGQVVLSVPPGETLWMLPRGLRWQCEPKLPGDPGSRPSPVPAPAPPVLRRGREDYEVPLLPLPPLRPSPGDAAGAPAPAPGHHVGHIPISPGDNHYNHHPSPPDPTRPSHPPSPLWMGFVEAAGGSGAGAAAAREGLGGPGETGDAVETGGPVSCAGCPGCPGCPGWPAGWPAKPSARETGDAVGAVETGDMVLGLGDSMVAGVRLAGGNPAPDGPCLRVVLEGPAEASSAGLRGGWRGGGCRSVCGWRWAYGRRVWRCRRICGAGVPNPRPIEVFPGPRDPRPIVPWPPRP